MSRYSTLLLIFALLALFGLQPAASSLFDASSSRNTIMNAYAGSSGIVDLKKNSSNSNDTFYVEADLYSYPSSSSAPPGTVKMMLSIVNSEIMVATNCMNFSNYDCSQPRYNCRNYGSSSSVVFPTFTAQTQPATSSLYLDYSYWSLSSDTLNIAYSCQSNDYNSSIGYNRYGVLGMGTNSMSRYHFSSSKVFSFNIERDLSKGTLLFKNAASTYAQSTSAAFTLSANSTWQYSFYSGSIKVSGYNTPIGTMSNVIFDINSDAIGLPYDTFRSLVNNFYRTPYVNSCTLDNYRPACKTYKKIEELPDITITVGAYALIIPSKIYATVISEGSSYTSFYFNFKATSPSLTGKSYITPAFQKSIILDAHFMSYYYVVFDASSPSSNYIYIYNPKNPGSGNGIWIGVGVVGVILLISLCYCLAKKKQNVTATTGVNNMTTDAFNYTQAPTVYNPQVPATVPDYTYNPNAYNYAQQPQGTYPNYNAGFQQPQGGVYNTGYVQPTGAYPQ